MSEKLSAQFVGKTVLITGASSGIGAQLAERLASAGMQVFMVARREDRLRELQAKISAQGGAADWVACDLSDLEQRSCLIEKIQSDWGVPDVLINNAGFGWYGYLKNAPWQEAEALLRVNVAALTHLTIAVLPEMCRRDSGHIVNIGSIVGVMPTQGIALYSGSKAYVDYFSTALYRELRGSRVHVGVIRPGPVKTEFFDRSANQPGSSRVPGERFSVTSSMVVDAIVAQLNHPKRFRFVPGWMRLTAWVEFFFGWVADLVGPVLLKRM